MTVAELLEQTKRSVNRHPESEQRALTGYQGTTTAGGYATADSPMYPVVIEALKASPMRTWSTVITTARGGPMSVPTVDDLSVAAQLLAENTGETPADHTFGQTVMDHWTYRAAVLASIEFWEDTISQASILATLANRVARLTNTHYTTGDGSAKPRGVVIAATDSTVSVTAATPTVDSLLDLKQTVDSQYWDSPKCCWMMNQQVLTNLKKALDATSVPLYVPRSATDPYDRLDGHPLIANPDISATAAQRGVVFGDFSRYIIRDVIGMQLIVNTQTKAEAGQVALRAVLRTDGDLVTTTAVKYATLA